MRKLVYDKDINYYTSTLGTIYSQGGSEYALCIPVLLLSLREKGACEKERDVERLVCVRLPTAGAALITQQDR